MTVSPLAISARCHLGIRAALQRLELLHTLAVLAAEPPPPDQSPPPPAPRPGLRPSAPWPRPPPSRRPCRPRPATRVRSPCRFRNRGTEHVSGSGMKRFSVVVQSDTNAADPHARRAGPRRPSPPPSLLGRAQPPGPSRRRSRRRECFVLATLKRERCQVGPKDASWPMHSCGNTAKKGRSWASFWANLGGVFLTRGHAGPPGRRVTSTCPPCSWRRARRQQHRDLRATAVRGHRLGRGLGFLPPQPGAGGSLLLALAPPPPIDKK
jgi:hypothetical protein